MSRHTTDELSEVFRQLASAPPEERTITRVQLPRELGRYTLEARIVEGGMGIVFRAFERALRRKIAIKLPQPRYSGKVQQRFVSGTQRQAAVRDVCASCSKAEHSAPSARQVGEVIVAVACATNRSELTRDHE